MNQIYYSWVYALRNPSQSTPVYHSLHRGNLHIYVSIASFIRAKLMTQPVSITDE